MVNLIIFIITCISISNIIVNENIFLKIRNYIDKVFPNSMLKQIMHCMTCSGFYIGIAVSLIFPVLGVQWFIGACISSISCKVFSIKFLTF